MGINETGEIIKLAGRLGQAKVHSSKTGLIMCANYLRVSLPKISEENTLFAMASDTSIYDRSSKSRFNSSGISISSFAMKATEPGIILGRALEKFDKPAVGKIDVLVNAGEGNIVDSIRKQRYQLDGLLAQGVNMLSRLAALELKVK